MAKIILVRHAESIANSQGIYQGQTYDTGLSSLGKKQAEALADKLYYFKIDKVVVSPLKRTLETASLITKKIGKDFEITSEIIETNHGDWEGQNKKWIFNKYPKILETWMKTPSKAEFPNGETFYETINRVKTFFFNKHWKGTTLIVTHDNIIRIFISLIKAKPIDQMWNMKLEPTGISIIEVTQNNGVKKFKLQSLNENSHLKDLSANITDHAL